jgi:nitrite reductase (NADH) small subunit
MSTITHAELTYAETATLPAAGRVWTPVCRWEELLPERGVAALVGSVQVALFRTFDGQLHAISNIDPFTGASVLSRGIVGSRGDIPVVASPLHKQIFDLRSGACLNDPDVAVLVFSTRVSEEGMVEVIAG